MHPRFCHVLQTCRAHNSSSRNVAIRQLEGTDKLHVTYSSGLAGKRSAYDGEKSLYTVGPLPRNNFEFIVVLEESIARSTGSTSDNGSPNDPSKRSKRSLLSKTFKVGYRTHRVSDKVTRSWGYPPRWVPDHNKHSSVRIFLELGELEMRIVTALLREVI